MDALSRLLAAVLLSTIFFGAAASEMPLLPAGSRLLIVSPHPDDESLCCGGYIHANANVGVNIYIVWVTNGDGYWRAAAARFKKPIPDVNDYQELGRLRMVEARNASKDLGVPDDHLLFLGFPDGGLDKLFDINYLRPYVSSRTKWSRVGYKSSPVFGTPYTGMALESVLIKIFRDIEPDLILMPAPEDEHSDHWATAKFAMNAALLTGRGRRVCRWIVHSKYDWPFPQGYFPKSSLGVPPTGSAYKWSKYELTRFDLEAKLAALSAYNSQLLVMHAFLMSFIRRDEMFSCVDIDYLLKKFRKEDSERRGSSW